MNYFATAVFTSISISVIAVLICPVVHGQVGGGRTEVLEKYYDDRCELAYSLDKAIDRSANGKITVATYNFGEKRMTYPANFTCRILFQGSKNCIPVFTCLTPINMRATISGKGHCVDEYLKISDGLGGEQKFCNNETVEDIRASSSGRELFVEYHSAAVAPDPKYTGFKCQASCLATNIQRTPNQKSGAPYGNILQTENSGLGKRLDTCTCGVQNKNTKNRIAGGTAAKEFEFPWLAAIVKKQTREPLCGASVINDRYVISAAHCFHTVDLMADDVEVLVHGHLMASVYQEGFGTAEFGESGSIKVPGWDLDIKSDADEHTERYSVERLIVHPLFSSNEMDNDIALLKLSKKIKLQGPEAITPICLPLHSDTKDDYKGATTTIAGWGLAYQSVGATTRILQKLEYVPVVNFRECESVMTKYKLTERMMCAGFRQGGRDSCQGDSGGPLMHTDKKTGQVKQLGVVSWGEDCGAEKSLGVYSDIQDHVQWIQYHTNNQDNSVWCSNIQMKF